MSHFDSVLSNKMDRFGSYLPVLEDLPAARTDCEVLRKCLEEYEFDEHDHVYWLAEDPDAQAVEGAMRAIRRQLMAGRDQQP